MAEDDRATWATDPETGAVTIPLKYPVRVGERTIDKVTLRRPKGKDLAAMEENAGGEMAQALRLIDRLLPEDTPIAGELDGVDVKRLSMVVADFLQVSLPTGATS